MKMFNKIIMASESEDNKLKTGVFGVEDGDTFTEAPVEDGAVVSIKGRYDHDLYRGLKDLNARKITAFDANAPIYGVVDYVGVSQADVEGVVYRIGDKIAGLGVPAGERTRVRMLELGDEFYLCEGNFDGTPDEGKYAYPVNGKTTWKVDAAPANSGLCIVIEEPRQLIMGQVNADSIMHACRVISL